MSAIEIAILVYISCGQIVYWVVDFGGMSDAWDAWSEMGEWLFLLLAWPFWLVMRPWPLKRKGWWM